MVIHVIIAPAWPQLLQKVECSPQFAGVSVSVDPRSGQPQSRGYGLGSGFPLAAPKRGEVERIDLVHHPIGATAADPQDLRGLLHVAVLGAQGGQERPRIGRAHLQRRPPGLCDPQLGTRAIRERRVVQDGRVGMQGQELAREQRELADVEGPVVRAEALDERGIEPRRRGPPAVPFDDLAAEAKRIATIIASKAPLAVSAAKRAVVDAGSLSLDDGLALEALLFGRAVMTEDFREGSSAFLEKRKPDFKGR